MRLDVFLISDAAAIADGKLYIHGGGVTRVHSAAFPSPPIQLALTVRLVMDPAEVATPHRYVVTVQDPDGEALVPDAVIEGAGGEPPEYVVDGEEHFVQFALGILLAFPQPGIYRFGLKVDDESLREGALAVIELPRDGGRDPLPPNRAERRRQQRAGGE